MSETVNFTINIGGNAYTGIAEIDKAMKTLSVTANENLKLFDKFNQVAFKLNNISQFVQNASNIISSAVQPGIALNSSLADLSAIAGVTGDKLKEIEGYARDTAKTFGTDAASSVESYKLLLSQLSPELGNYPTALRAMGDNIATLSKTMGGDATAAAEVLTTAMNQYGISMDDPMEASRKMAEMMNVMAAAGKEGSAELPTIKSALEQCGMAAKAAGVSFEETNAAIQVLDKAGKKGSEGGVALRNTMATLSQGRFLPKDVQEELSMAGVDILKLGDKTLSLSDRLNMLKPVMNDTALFTKLFGRENANAAMALVQGTDEINRYTEAISGTNTAEEQAAVIMESFAEKQARIQARFDDIKISIFNATGDLGLWVDVVAKSLIPLSQLLPLIKALGKGISYLNTKFISSSKAAIYFKKQLNKVAGNAVRVAVLSLGLAFGRLKYSIGIAGGCFNFFKITGVNACRAIGKAIMQIPIIGWIAAIIAVIITVIGLIWKLFKLLWDKCEGFRRLLFGIWEVIKLPFVLIGNVISSIWDAAVGLFQSLMARAKQIIGSIIQWIKGIFSGIGGWFSKVMQPVKDWFSNLKTFVKSIFDSIFGWLGKVFSPIIELWNKISAKYKIGAEKGSESFRRSKNPDDPDDPDFGIADPTLPGISSEEISGNGGVVPSDVSSGVSATTTGGTRNTNVTINLGKMADVTFNGGVGENAEDMVRKIEECLLRVLYMAQNA